MIKLKVNQITNKQGRGNVKLFAVVQEVKLD